MSLDKSALHSQRVNQMLLQLQQWRGPLHIALFAALILDGILFMYFEYTENHHYKMIALYGFLLLMLAFVAEEFWSRREYRRYLKDSKAISKHNDAVDALRKGKKAKRASSTHPTLGTRR